MNQNLPVTLTKNTEPPNWDLLNQSMAGGPGMCVFQMLPVILTGVLREEPGKHSSDSTACSVLNRKIGFWRSLEILCSSRDILKFSERVDSNDPCLPSSGHNQYLSSTYLS
jgi:hypothetical protein